MALSFVSEKSINGKVYTAYRDSVDPRIQAIECEGIQKQCKLRDVWPSDQAIEALWH